MPQKPSSPDLFARGLAVAGLLLSVIGLVLTYYNYRWQKTVYQENIEERILTRLSSKRTISFTTEHFDPKGEMVVEVVNIGLRPIYLKSVEMRIADPSSHGEFVFAFYGHKSPVRPNESKPNESIKLEPSQSRSFRMSWDFKEHPIHEWSEGSYTVGREEKIELQVDTTKKSFTLPSPLEEIDMDMPLQPRAR